MPGSWRPAGSSICCMPPPSLPLDAASDSEDEDSEELDELASESEELDDDGDE